MHHVDLHLHLLPGVDDGPPDDAASVRHAARLVASGVRQATVTPHVGHPRFPLDVVTVAERTARLSALLAAEGLELCLHPGGELHPRAAWDLSRSELELVAQGPPGRRWLLAEVPFAGVDEPFLDGCRRLRGLGFGLVIAHPERAAGFRASGLRLLRPELLSGAVLQVNVCSLLGDHGEEAQATARRLVCSGLAYVLASDGHGDARPHTLAQGVSLARDAGASAVRAWQLVAANPGLLLGAGLAPVRAASPLRRGPTPRGVLHAVGETRRQWHARRG